MSSVTTRNRNKGKFYKDGRAKPANWEYRFEKVKVEGKRQHESKAGFKTQKEAFEAGTRALAEYLNSGQTFKSDSISYADYLDIWFKEYVEINLRPTTQTKYKGMMNKHLKPALGGFKIQSITPATLQTFINSYKDKYSHQTIRNVMNLLKMSFSFAVEPMQYIKQNPMIHVKRPKIERKRTRERYIITREQWQTITDKFTPESKYHIPLMIGYHAGLRIGETLALTWDDINFEENTLTVNKQIVAYKPKNGVRKWCIAPPKTPASNRTIHIGKTLLDALKKEKLKQKQNRLLYGEYYHNYTMKEVEPRYNEILLKHDNAPDLNFICVQENGAFMNWDNLRYCFRVIQNALDIKFEYHSLRHTHATLLVESGANIKSIQRRLGHERIETTLQTYVHDTEEMHHETVDIFERTINTH